MKGASDACALKAEAAVRELFCLTTELCEVCATCFHEMHQATEGWVRNFDASKPNVALRAAASSLSYNRTRHVGWAHPGVVSEELAERWEQTGRRVCALLDQAREYGDWSRLRERHGQAGARLVLAARLRTCEDLLEAMQDPGEQLLDEAEIEGLRIADPTLFEEMCEKTGCESAIVLMVRTASVRDAFWAAEALRTGT